jgi:anti-sigma factor RsiW
LAFPVFFQTAAIFPGEDPMQAKCKEVQERLSAWLDGEAEEAWQAALSAHLEGCARCRRELAQLQALDAVLGDLPAPAPLYLADRVLARLPQLRPPRRWWQSLALAATLVMGLTLGGALVGNFYPMAPANGDGAEMAALEDFQDFPAGSLGAVLASYHPEEGNGL